MVTSQNHLTLIERQSSEIDANVSRDILDDASFNCLIDAGIIEFGRKRGGKHLVRANQFVGRATLNSGIEVVISEKVEGAAAGMLPWASPNDIRSALVDSHITNSTDMLQAIVEHFLRAVAEYLSKGATKNYLYANLTTSNPRGKIDSLATSKLRAKGIYGRVTCRPSRLSGLNRANSLIALALLCLDGFEGQFSIEEELRISTRVFLPYFTECDFYSLRRMALPLRSMQFNEEIALATKSIEQRKALGYGRALALHAMSCFGNIEIAQLPSAYFINLESLFEDAVLGCLKDILQPIEVLRPSEMDRLPILDDVSGRYLASPDALWLSPDQRYVVADCKYKILEQAPAHSDLYQILAHAEAYAAPVAIIFYPGLFANFQYLGRTRMGTEAYSATVRCPQLRGDVEEVISAIYQSRGL